MLKTIIALALKAIYFFLPEKKLFSLDAARAFFSFIERLYKMFKTLFNKSIAAAFRATAALAPFEKLKKEELLPRLFEQKLIISRESQRKTFKFTVQNEDIFRLEKIGIVYTSVNEISPSRFNCIYKLWDETLIQIIDLAGRLFFRAFLSQLFCKTRYYYKRKNRRKTQRFETAFILPYPLAILKNSYFILEASWPDSYNEGDRIFITLAGTAKRSAE